MLIYLSNLNTIKTALITLIKYNNHRQIDPNLLIISVGKRCSSKTSISWKISQLITKLLGFILFDHCLFITELEVRDEKTTCTQ